MKDNYLIQAWLILTLAVVFGGALAGVQIVLGPRIEQNKENETLSLIPSLVPGAATGQKTVVGEIPAYKALDADGKQVGWVIKGSGSGYADKIEILIGLDLTAEMITGLRVLEHKETPGLGSKIKDDESWAAQFEGRRTAAELKVDKEGGQIRSVTSATVSSKSVCQIANNAIAAFKTALAGLDPAEMRLGDVVPGAASGRKLSVAGVTVYEALGASNERLGWAVLASGEGYNEGEPIVLLVGLDAAVEKITGLAVLSHGETPGLGGRITEKPWLRQFVGKPADGTITPVKRTPRPGANEIKVISGATVSSRSVCRIVNDATARLKGRLGKATGTAP